MKYKILPIILFLLAAVVSYLSGKAFLEMRIPEPIYPGPGVTTVSHLSDYFDGIKGTRLDTDVYFLEGEQPGGTVLVLGGTHPNETAGFIAAVLLVENAVLEQGRLIVIPRANNSGFSCTDPGEGVPSRFTIDTPNGKRWFRFGSRFTNWVDQWPDPLVYLHYPSGQRLSGTETRNLNRAYPGRSNGSPTERLAYAIVELITSEQVDLAVDLHESAPEYPVNNAIIAHEKANDVVATAIFALQMEDLEYSFEPSPYNFHGLSHREWGDYTDTLPILMETANPIQGRLRGRTTPELIVTGLDKTYVKASKITDREVLRVPYDEAGIPLKVRVGRHVAALEAMIAGFSELHPDRPITVSHLPSYAVLQENGVGFYLRPSD